MSHEKDKTCWGVSPISHYNRMGATQIDSTDTYWSNILTNQGPVFPVAGGSTAGEYMYVSVEDQKSLLQWEKAMKTSALHSLSEH